MIPSHVLSVFLVATTTKDVLGEVDLLALLEGGDAVIVATVDTLHAAASREVQTEEATELLIEVGFGVATVGLGNTFGESCISVLVLVAVTQELIKPDVVFLITLSIGVLGGDGFLDLFACRSQ